MEYNGVFKFYNIWLQNHVYELPMIFLGPVVSL